MVNRLRHHWAIVLTRNCDAAAGRGGREPFRGRGLQHASAVPGPATRELRNAMAAAHAPPRPGPAPGIARTLAPARLPARPRPPPHFGPFVRPPPACMRTCVSVVARFSSRPSMPATWIRRTRFLESNSGDPDMPIIVSHSWALVGLGAGGWVAGKSGAGRGGPKGKMGPRHGPARGPPTTGARHPP